MQLDPKPYYSNSGIEIYLGDCREVIPRLPQHGQVKLIVTSPPYNVGVEYGTWNDNLPQDEYWQFTREWLSASYNALRPSGRICVNVPNLGNSFESKSGGIIPFAPRMIDALVDCGFTVREWITWVKSTSNNLNEVESSFCGNNCAWGSWLSPSNPFCRSFSEFILIAHKGSPALEWTGETDLTKRNFLLWSRNIWLMPTATHPKHPAPFPSELPKRVMQMYSYIGDLILDPFCGVGTTLKEAMRLRRPAVGIEISERYAEIAAQNCMQEWLL